MKLHPGERIVSLHNLNQGAAIIMFDEALEKVLENIADPNIPAEAKRKIVLTVTIQPDRQRRMGNADIGIDLKLAGRIGASTTIYLAGKEAGRRVAVENDPGQGGLFDEDVPSNDRNEKGDTRAN